MGPRKGLKRATSAVFQPRQGQKAGGSLSCVPRALHRAGGCSPVPHPCSGSRWSWPRAAPCTCLPPSPASVPDHGIFSIRLGEHFSPRFLAGYQMLLFFCRRGCSAPARISHMWARASSGDGASGTPRGWKRESEQLMLRLDHPSPKCSGLGAPSTAPVLCPQCHRGGRAMVVMKSARVRAAGVGRWGCKCYFLAQCPVTLPYDGCA